VESHLAKFYPDEVLSPKLRETVEGILRTTS
jgi:hypothetical protein